MPKSGFTMISSYNFYDKDEENTYNLFFLLCIYGLNLARGIYWISWEHKVRNPW